MHWERQPGRYPRDPRLGHRPGISYIPTRGENETLKDLYTNQEGFVCLKDEPYEEIDWRSERLIVILGGSVAMGLGASCNRKTSAALLQSWLNEKPGKTYQVVNAACGAHCSWQELIRFTMEISDRRPWMVFSISSWNDFIHSAIGCRDTRMWHKNHDRSIDDLSEILVTGRARKKNSLANKAKKAILRLRGKRFSEGEIQWGYHNCEFTPREHAADNYIHNMNQLKAITRSLGGEFKCLLQPQVLMNPSEDRKSNKAEQDILRLEANHEGFKHARQVFYSRLDKRKEKGFIQDLGYYESEKFIDHCHLNDEGQVQLAKRLLEEVLASANT